jgi:hypothetical protein
MTIMIRPSGAPFLWLTSPMAYATYRRSAAGFHEGVETEAIELLGVLFPHLQRISGLVGYHYLMPRLRRSLPFTSVILVSCKSC